MKPGAEPSEAANSMQTARESLSRCHLCGGENWARVTDIGENFNGEIVNLCRQCGLVFLSPRLDEAGLRQFYATDTFSELCRGSAVPGAAELAEAEARARPRLELLLERMNAEQIGSALEIGCSCGSFCEGLKRRGVERIIGVDPSRGYVEFGRKQYELDLRFGTFPEAIKKSEGPFDLIALFHVLEHMADPSRTLHEIHERLSEGGWLILEVPDLAVALRRRWLHRRYFHRAHLFDFTEATLLTFLGKSGFSPLEVVHPASEPPLDKNLLVLARRSAPAEEPVAWDRKRAAQLLELLRRKHNPGLLKRMIGRLAPRVL